MQYVRQAGDPSTTGMSEGLWIWCTSNCYELEWTRTRPRWAKHVGKSDIVALHAVSLDFDWLAYFSCVACWLGDAQEYLNGFNILRYHWRIVVPNAFNLTILLARTVRVYVWCVGKSHE